MESFKWHELGQTYEEIAEAFWRLSGLPETFPRDIFTACIWTLPVGVIWITGLTGSAVASYLPSSQNAEQLGQYAFSPLYGCLVAAKGAGIIFLERDMPQSEASFTVAHEVSHFLMDYLIPRERALSKMGEGIRPVLDGERAPAVDERVDALLCGIPLGTYVNATPRERRSFSEDRADMLALELLAPARRVLQEILGEQDPSRPLEPKRRHDTGSELQEVSREDGGVYGYVASREAMPLSKGKEGTKRATPTHVRTIDVIPGEQGGVLPGASLEMPPGTVLEGAGKGANIAGVLMTKYGLPASVARWYAGYLDTRLHRGGSGGFREWLEGSGSSWRRQV